MSIHSTSQYYIHVYVHMYPCTSIYINGIEAHTASGMTKVSVKFQLCLSTQLAIIISTIYMEIHVYSILAKKEQEEKKENHPPHTPTTNRPTHVHIHTQKGQDKHVHVSLVY